MTTRTLLLTALLLAGCASNEPAPAPAPSGSTPTASVVTPSNVVQRFRDVLRAELVTSAMFMIDELDYGSPIAEQIKLRIKRTAEDMARGAYDFRPVDEQVQSGCAAVIVRENPGKAGQFVAFYLVQREGLWKVAPQATSYESFRSLSAAQQATFKALERWYQLRKADLLVEERGK